MAMCYGNVDVPGVREKAAKTDICPPSFLPSRARELHAANDVLKELREPCWIQLPMNGCLPQMSLHTRKISTVHAATSEKMLSD